MKRTILALLLTVTTAVSLYACSGDDSTIGSNGSDGGNTQSDGSSNDGTFASDTSTNEDSGVDGGLNSTSLQILAVKNAAPPLPDGGDEPPFTVSLPIDHALVTYVRPAVLPDPAGFFLQAEQTGPAVFVAIDPTTLSTVPAPGDDVSMTVTSVGQRGFASRDSRDHRFQGKFARKRDRAASSPRELVDGSRHQARQLRERVHRARRLRHRKIRRIRRVGERRERHRCIFITERVAAAASATRRANAFRHPSLLPIFR